MTTAVRPSDHAARFGRPMTEDEWVALDKDEPGELVDGILVEEEMPSAIHDVVAYWLSYVFWSWCADRGGVAVGALNFILAPGHGRMPDVCVFFPRKRKLPAHGAIRFPADIMVEVISQRARDIRRDRVAKMREYAKFGVPYYWIVDPHARTVEIYARNERGRYVLEVSADEGKLETIPGCEGLVLDIDTMWKKVDEALEMGLDDEG